MGNIIAGGKKDKFYGGDLMSYPGGMPGSDKYEIEDPTQIKPSPSDTIYKHNGNKISKLDFNSMIKSNQSTIQSTQKHNDSVSARATSVNKMFPPESSSMDQRLMSLRLQKEINKGKIPLKKGITTGSFTRSVEGEEIDRRSFSTL
jgi:hypothetical protein